mmetsp:Transcript_36604/g.80394  ORF Transcript_36604/g.80394 Transcript_36604/m.80394 type:complete len:83 (+) Transcript_36604:327-575(+)
MLSFVGIVTVIVTVIVCACEEAAVVNARYVLVLGVSAGGCETFEGVAHIGACPKTPRGLARLALDAALQARHAGHTRKTQCR